MSIMSPLKNMKFSAVRVRKGSNNAKQNHERIISKIVERIETYIINAEISFGVMLLEIYYQKICINFPMTL